MVLLLKRNTWREEEKETKRSRNFRQAEDKVEELKEARMDGHRKAFPFSNIQESVLGSMWSKPWSQGGPEPSVTKSGAASTARCGWSSPIQSDSSLGIRSVVNLGFSGLVVWRLWRKCQKVPRLDFGKCRGSFGVLEAKGCMEVQSGSAMDP